MIESLKKLIESLRDELKNYGEMLVLLERQQAQLVTRAAHEVSHSISLIQAQGVVIQEVREQREKCRRAVAEAAGQEENTCFAELILLLPADYQPLLKALVNENNELLFRVRRQARQNHLILQRSVELMQEVMNSLCPPGRTPVVNGHVKPRIRSRATRRLREAVN
jgi:hypothetical protein